jgi:hypothetical protein
LKSHLSNTAYGVLDYAAYPLAMLVAAMNTGSIIASGFGGANVQYISGMKGLGNRELMLRATGEARLPKSGIHPLCEDL